MMTLLMPKTYLFATIAAVFVVFCAYLVHWGDTHGFNARRLHQIERELADVNSRIAGYTLRDDQAAIDADVLRSEGYHKALSELGTVDKCVVTPAMVRAFERVVQ